MNSYQNKRVSRVLLLILSALLSYLALTYPLALRPSYLPITVGNVAPQDIQAPVSMTYESAVQTEAAKKEAERSISPIYLPADPAIARQKLDDLRTTIQYITSVRADQFSNLDQKNIDLQLLKNVKFNSEEISSILSLSDERWESIQQESLRVLEEVMRSTIRTDQVFDARQSIPSRISLSFSPGSNTIITRLVEQHIAANSQFSEDRTRAAIDQARNAVQPVSRSLLSGEIIVRRGQIVTPLILETLEKFDLVRPRSGYTNFIAPAGIILIIASFIAVYFYRRPSPSLNNWRSLLLISTLFLIFLFLARFIIPNRTVFPYLFPIAGFGLTIACLFNVEVGMVLSLALSILASFGLSSSLDLTLYYALTSMIGILVLGKGMRVSSFFSAAAVIGCTGSIIIIAYRLSPGSIDLVGLATLLGSAFVNGLASASLALLFQVFLSQLLGTTTALQLLDLSRPDHPVMQFMLRNAPGSYQHSLQVANLAEQAAEAIGADVLLTRVGAIYHDIGKAANPQFFIENQVSGKSNPHDDISAEESSGIIIRHITDGILIARKHHLPPRIIDFIQEHHGTLLTRYQYARAIQESAGQIEQVNIEKFRYPGPSPRSKETALLMLADGCEARARAELPRSEVEIRSLVKKVFDYLQQEGQLDHTNLTLRDLYLAAESFTKTLRNSYHPRIIYPEIKTSNTPTVPVSQTEEIQTGDRKP
ncbi:MAG: HDIG domain-containing protein [Leptolinea sp.]|jgi:putative nucleotidyltransferase with HDIG domain|nr:HDIG domain-containing protein [Leptolinea sp.]